MSPQFQSPKPQPGEGPMHENETTFQSNEIKMQTEKHSKITVWKGIGIESPNEGCKCRVRLKCFLQNGKTTDEGEREIIIGEGDNELSEILDGCLECMHMKETCHIKLSPTDSSTCQSLQVDSSTILMCEVELLDFSRVKEVWEYSPTEKLERANHHKFKGTECFKLGKYVAAARRYSRALKMLILLRENLPDEEQVQYDQLKLTCYLNLAACQGKLGRHQHVVENCSKVLAVNKANIKALYRRGTAYVELNETEKAKEDLQKALQIEPSNCAVQEQLSLLKQKERQQDAIYAKALRSMFAST